MLERFLYFDATEREQLLDLSMRLRRTYAVAVAFMLVPFSFGYGVFGWSAEYPLFVAAAVYIALNLFLTRVRYPELLLFVSCIVGVIGTLASIWFAHGPKEFLFAMPVVPMVGMAPIFQRRISVAAALLTSVGIVAVGLGSYGEQVRAMPPIVIMPIILLLVIVLGSMASRNAESVNRSTAVVDPLTGLLNRVALQSRATELELHVSATGDRVGLIIADLDHVRHANADHGRAKGDAIIVEAAERIRAELGTAGSVFRFGGDEFVVLLQGATPGMALEWAERLREAVRFAAIADVPVTASFGVSVTTLDAPFDYRHLFFEADEALYQAKSGGRDRVCVASDLTALAESAESIVRRATDLPATDPAPTGADAGWSVEIDGPAEGNWLVGDAIERAHVIDLLERSRRDSELNSAITLGGLLLCGFWLGWWIVLPPVVAGLFWRLCTTRLPRVRRPEFAAFIGVLAMVVAAALAVGLAGPKALFGLPMTSLVVFGACAGFNRFGAVVIGLVAMVSTTIVAFAVDAAAITATPYILAFPLALIAANALLGGAMGSSARSHRVSAITDSQTGTLNRAALDARIPQLSQHLQTSPCPTTLLAVDIDRFQKVNDDYGHPSGDVVLGEVAYRLRSSLRSFDSVYRVDGGAFLVVLVDTDGSDAVAIANRMRRLVEAEPVQGIPVTVSIGLACAQAGEPLDYEAVSSLAAGRLQRAKDDGRNRVVDGGDPPSPLRLVAAA
jgi:diguanylate cyclase (GGDEF)-like protein